MLYTFIFSYHKALNILNRTAANNALQDPMIVVLSCHQEEYGAQPPASSNENSNWCPALLLG